MFYHHFDDLYLADKATLRECTLYGRYPLLYYKKQINLEKRKEF